mgnify:CR=1 FL=1
MNELWEMMLAAGAFSLALLVGTGALGWALLVLIPILRAAVGN